jgi:HlyD family secretion protein
VRFYVPEPRLSPLHVGGTVAVACDGCPAGLTGRLSFISSRQEYTPPVIFSDVERAKLVFKAEARLEGKARDLPLGMPVSVTPATATEAAK